ncbi:MAG: hypothetical protein RIS43_910 [Actinomycetota bacterium]
MTEENNGKGRATRSRKEAEAARKNTLKVPADKKLARKAMRERDAEARLNMRRAMYTLDEKHLPLRDRGPVKRFIRDYVDSRITVGEMFVPAAFAIMLMLFGGANNITLQLYASAAWTVLFAAFVLDSVIFAIRIRRIIRKEFGEDELRGVVFYALSRSITFRATRLPKPAVKVGGAPKATKLPKSLQK